MTTKESLNQSTSVTHLNTSLHLNNHVNTSTDNEITKNKLKSFIVYGLAVIGSVYAVYTLHEYYKDYTNLTLTVNNMKNSLSEFKYPTNNKPIYWDFF